MNIPLDIKALIESRSLAGLSGTPYLCSSQPSLLHGRLL